VFDNEKGKGAVAMAGGYIKVFRSILDTPAYQDDRLARLWFHCLLRANFRDRHVPLDGVLQPVLIRRGQFLTSRRTLHAELYKKKRKHDPSTVSVWKRLQILRDLSYIDLETCRHYTIVTVCNYETYQAEPSNSEPPNLPQACHGLATGLPQACHGLAREKKDKKEEKVKKEEKKTAEKRRSFSKEDLATADWIFKKILEFSPSHRPPDLHAWASTIRLMRERDNRTDAEVRDLFQWANEDGFWRATILSPAKLRAKWDTLVAQQIRGQTHGRKATQGGRIHRTDWSKIPVRRSGDSGP
jgi:hypothetical protein